MMTPLQKMPNFIAANHGPHLRRAVRVFKAGGLTAQRVRFFLEAPPIDTFQEIWAQHPPPGAALTSSSSIELTVHPDSGVFAPVKNAWADQLTAGRLDAAEVSQWLWLMGDMENLLADPAALLLELLENAATWPPTFLGLTPDDYHCFSPHEKATLIRLLPLKPNSHQPLVLSRLFTRILNLPFTFRTILSATLPHTLIATVGVPRTEFSAILQHKLYILETLFVPVTCCVVYRYMYPGAILNHPDTRLNAVQLE